MHLGMPGFWARRPAAATGAALRKATGMSVAPAAGMPYHEHCWQANGNRCSKADCEGLPMQITDADTSLLARACGRDGGKFAVGEEFVRCPRCGMPNHEHCWQANGNYCSRPDCKGPPIADPSRPDWYWDPSTHQMRPHLSDRPLDLSARGWKFKPPPPSRLRNFSAADFDPQDPALGRLPAAQYQRVGPVSL